MRFKTKVMAAFAMAPVALAQTPASALPYDPYPWCAVIRGAWVAAAQIAVSSLLSSVGQP